MLCYLLRHIKQLLFSRVLHKVSTVMVVGSYLVYLIILGVVRISVSSNPSLSAWWAEQDNRQSGIQSVCEKYRQNVPHDLGPWGVSKFSYSDRYNLLFCRNQKV